MLLDRARVGGPAAEPRDRLGDPQRVAGADRLAQRDVGEHGAGDRVGGGAQAVDRAGVVVERERHELVERRRVELGRGQRDDEEAGVELARADADRPRVGGRAGLGELDQRADDRRDEQPLALGGLLRVGAQRGGRRRGGEQPRRRRGRSRPRRARRSRSA